ncbi:hypothetical protein [Roseococcus sp.]|uniref:hypothetical protein n=1 Tax=Roseococcus sp. TaxID=2109646 RepID=UPI003BAB1971
MSIANLASEISGKLGGANIGGEIAVGVTSSRGDGPGNLYLDVSGRKAEFKNDEEGSKQLAEKAGEYLLELFKDYNGGNGDYQGILRASGSIEALGQNLEYYEGTYKALTGTAEATSEFGKQIAALSTQWQTAIDKANELSLATDVLNSKRDEDIAKAYAARDLQVRGFDLGLDIRSARATGANDTALMQQAALMQFDLAAEQQLVQAKAALEALGKDSDEVATRIVRNEQVLAEERLKIQQDYSDQILGITRKTAESQKQAAQSVLEWLNDQALGTSSSLSATAKLAEAERQYNAALASGDTSSLTKSAGSLIELSRDVFGGATDAFAQREAFVRSSVANAGLREAQGSGNADVVSALSQMVTVLQQELQALRAEYRAGNDEARAAALSGLAK